MPKKLKRKPLHRQVHRHLKLWLVPHKHNDHRPHLIRVHGLAVVAVLVIGVQFTANWVRPTAVRVPDSNVLAYATDITPVSILNHTNAERASRGLPAFKLDSRLNQSAALKSGNMFSENYWAHVSPSGIQPWHWFQQASYGYSYAGENLAKDFDTSAGTVQGWMNSAGHRANILSTNYKDIGISVQNGTLLGGQTTLVVAHYGATAGSSGVAAAPPAPKVATTKPAATPAPAPPATTAPAPTAAPTTAATPTPSPTVAVAQVTPSAPPPTDYGLFKPLSLTQTLSLGTLMTLVLLTLLLGVYALTHVTVWRKGLGRWRHAHYRLAAAGQIGGLSTAIVMLAVSGFGSVG